MADFSVPVTVPDAKVNELVAALRWHWGKKEDGTEMSGAELRTKLKESVEQSLKDIYARHKRYLHDQQSLDDELPVE